MPAAALSAGDWSFQGSVARNPGPSGLLAGIYALSIAGFPLASVTSLLAGLDGTIVSILFRVLLIALVLSLMVRWLLVGGELYAGYFLLPTFALWLVLIARMIWDIHVSPMNGLERGDPDPVRWVTLSLGACFLPALAFLERPDSRTLRSARILAQLMAAVALIVICVYGVQSIRTGQIFHRLSTEEFNPISVGHLGVSLFIISAVAWLNARERGSGRSGRRTMHLALAALGLVTTAASFSRGPILAIIAACALMVVFHRGMGSNLLTRIVRGGGVLVLLLSAVGLVAYRLEAAGYIEVLSRFNVDLADESSMERFTLFEGAWQQFIANPIVGDAFVERSQMTYPHNMLLESLMSTGIIGGILLLFVLFVGCASALRLLRANDERTWVGLIYFQNLIGLVVSGSILTGSMFWAATLACFSLGAAVPGSRSEITNQVPEVSNA